MHFYVDIDFKKGPSFGLEVIAQDKVEAERIACHAAPSYGFDEKVKRVKVREINPQEQR